MPQSPVIPKEKLSAYQRWELGSFDQPAEATQAATQLEVVKQLDAQARDDGYRAGYTEGLEAARLQAQGEAARRIAQMDELLAALQADLVRVDRELANDVVQLGLVVARKVIGSALEANSELVQSCVEEALRHVAHASGRLNVVVNPGDAELVREHLELSPRAGTWAIVEDPQVLRGGCRIESAAGEINATVETRWERITAALGNQQGWSK